MNPDLEILNKELEGHFNVLSNIRSSNIPVFALEHGLSESVLTDIQSKIRSLQNIELCRMESIWLLWVIYAAEEGYSYTGEEYWQSFENQINGFEVKDRNIIKKWFLRFHQKYNGVRPIGHWAEHFTIISWPITHALLPRYLQLQFARSLFGLRYQLVKYLQTPPFDTLIIGQLLANNIHMPSNRFKEFLQQEELIGQIVLAILFGEEAFMENQSIIYPKTLNRVVDDLNSVHSSREWLKDTKRYITDRFKGLGYGTWKGNDIITREPKPPVENFNICPRLFLRHSGGNHWSVLLDIPSFRKVSSLNSEINKFFRESRCQLNGGKDTKPKGWLISGSRKGLLQTWPDPTKPLLGFVKKHPLIDQLLLAECLPSKGPNWVFKVRNDGTATQVKGGYVRPGNNYIVVSTGELLQSNDILKECTLECEGVKAFRMNLPAHTSTGIHKLVNEVGLKITRSIQVWPSGIQSCFWDGEGNSEWLTTDSPCIGILPDHPVESLTFHLNGTEEKTIKTLGNQKPVFIRLEPLPAGTYTLTVKESRAKELDSLTSSTPAEGYLHLNIRDPEPWNPGITSYSGLFVSLDPIESDLDTFMQNKVTLNIFGPEKYTVTLGIKLETGDCKLVLDEQIGEPFDIPFKQEKWQIVFKKFLEPKEISEYFLEATKGTLTIDGGPLGKRLFIFEHANKPLRWLLKKRYDSIRIKLLDDTGQDGTNTKICRYDMKHPLTEIPLMHNKAMEGVNVEPPGSLFYTEYDSVVVSNPKNEKSLQGLRLSPQIPKLNKTIPKLLDALNILAKWQKARLKGNLINLWQIEIYDGILESIYEALYSQKWIIAETNFRENPSTNTLEALKSRVDKKSNRFAEKLAEEWPSVKSGYTQSTVSFAEIVSRSGLGDDPKFAKFAERLANQPHELCSLSRNDPLFQKGLENPTILRGARLISLITRSEKENATLPLVSRCNW